MRPFRWKRRGLLDGRAARPSGTRNTSRRIDTGRPPRLPSNFQPPKLDASWGFEQHRHRPHGSPLAWGVPIGAAPLHPQGWPGRRGKNIWWLDAFGIAPNSRTPNRPWKIFPEWGIDAPAPPANKHFFARPRPCNPIGKSKRGRKESFSVRNRPKRRDRIWGRPWLNRKINPIPILVPALVGFFSFASGPLKISGENAWDRRCFQSLGRSAARPLRRRRGGGGLNPKGRPLRFWNPPRGGLGLDQPDRMGKRPGRGGYKIDQVGEMKLIRLSFLFPPLSEIDSLG